MNPAPEGDDPKRLRQPPSPHDRELNLSARAWLKELPPAVVPVALASRFPRIVNRLSRFWDSPGMMKACFRELLCHRRTGRQGFPEHVLHELFALEQYYHQLHKTQETDAWSSVPPRRP
ncbi:MAG TPA: hypothetical protein VF229_06400 [Burkholderiaceae bacterium]